MATHQSPELGRACLLKWHHGGLPWQTVTSVLRIMTDPRLTGERLTLEEAVDIVEQWLAQQNIRFLGPAISSIDQQALAF
jgi:hypothetical protein